MKWTHRTGMRITLVAALAGTIGAVLGAASLGSAATAAAPVNLDPPTISGRTEVGATLTASTGRWSNTPTDFDYQWRRCDEAGGNCASISSATSRTYVLRQVDREDTLRVRVTARNADGSAQATSAQTAVITNPAATTGCARPAPVPVAELALPERLLIDRQDISPPVIGRSTESLTVRFRVSACNGKAVQGALVYVTATPYNQFTVPDEVQTGADGWASLTMRRLSGYPATPRQQLLVIFARARKAGENELAGISTRRLVSFPVDLNR